MMRRLALLLALLTMLLAPPASAHEVGLSRGDYAIETGGAALTADLTFARRELAGFVEGLDQDRDGTIDAAEIARGRDALGVAMLAGIRVRSDAARCPGTLVSAGLDAEDGVAVRLRFTCPAPAPELTVDLALLEDLPAGHRHLAHYADGGRSSDALLSRRSRTFTIHGDPTIATSPTSLARAAPAYRGKLSFFPMGIEHILLGYDHLVFLFGLVLVGGRPRALLLVITAFTVAHSITLATAVLGVWAPSPRIVEPAIALSIAYVGVENFFVRDAEARWRITFPFGLIHGFGFAGALREIAMPRADVPAALVLFNLGVEAGQLAVLAALLPLLFLARRHGLLQRRGIRVLSGAIVVAGLVWFVARVAAG